MVVRGGQWQTSLLPAASTNKRAHTTRAHPPRENRTRRCAISDPILRHIRHALEHVDQRSSLLVERWKLNYALVMHDAPAELLGEELDLLVLFVSFPIPVVRVIEGGIVISSAPSLILAYCWVSTRGGYPQQPTRSRPRRSVIFL